MQPTEPLRKADAVPSSGHGRSALGPIIAHAAVLLLRALAIVVLAAPVVIGLVLLLR